VSVGAKADISMVFGQQGHFATDENVNMDSASGMNVYAHTNQTLADVLFTSNENIIAPASGQARVEAADGVGYRELCMQFEPGMGAQTVEVNVNLGKRLSGNATWTAYDQLGNSFTFSPQAIDDNGNNWFDFSAINGEFITKVCMTSDVDV